ncbi:MAG: carboxypeptidase M32 [Proteobacteria bacterium]|nr:carboxypeptidase M32 [Pseudomonadota bacterium]
MKAYQQLETAFRQLAHLNHVSAICHWDEAVMMPPGGGAARAEALAGLQAFRHQQLTNPKIKDWLEQAKSAVNLTNWQKANLYWMQDNYLKASCLPSDLVQRSELAFIRCEQAWRMLRAENNWSDFLPLLKENLALIREAAQIKSEVFAMDPYDCLIEQFSPGLSQKIIDPIFEQLAAFLPQFVAQVMARQQPAESILGHFPIESQKQLGLQLMRAIGFDFNHGRLDVSHHPFCGGVPQDVRITTRYTENEFISASMGICHETGHALYERGLPTEWLNQPVGEALGMAVHESQSLLIEMQACRSIEFMQFLSPLVKEYFGDQPVFSAENLYRHYTTVRPGLIRVDADEVCYPLHIILRYQLEKQLIKGTIDCEALPEIWHDYMQKYFNLSTCNDFRNGVMQDVHWPSGAFGYFPAYTIGAIIAAQLFQTAIRTDSEIPEQLTRGNFKLLVDWLRNNVHSKGRLLNMNDLLIQATGQPLTADFFLKHLQNRYGK